MERFDYSPSKHVPFRDKEVLERVRSIKREELPNIPPSPSVTLLELFSSIRRRICLFLSLGVSPCL